MIHITDEINRISTSESYCGNILMIGNNLIFALSNVNITDNGEDLIFNKNTNSFLNFCYILLEGIEAITYDYDDSKLVDNFTRSCFGGTHYITLNYNELWVSYRTAQVLLPNFYKFSKMPIPFSQKESIDLIKDNPITDELLLLLGVYKTSDCSDM